MHIQTYTYILHVWYEWLKTHKRLVLGVVFGLLTVMHAGVLSEGITDAYILMRMKEPEKIILVGPRKRVVAKRRVVSMAASSSSSSSPYISPRRKFVPRGKASSRSSLRPAAPDEDPRTGTGSLDDTGSGSVLPPSSSESSSSSASSVSPLPTDGFPAFDHAVMPVGKAPNWGDMRTPDEWNRWYDELRDEDFVSIPVYDITDLTSKTMKELLETRNDPRTIRILTEKLIYSTRYFGAYDLDAEEFTGIHPGIDIKLAEGTPVGAIAGGRVHAAISKNSGLGLHVIIEHRLPDGSQYFSIYGHLGSVNVAAGDIVKPGDIIGAIGMTGKTTSPHLHLQIDRGYGEEDTHVPYMPDHLPTRSEAARFVVHPIEFIRMYAN